MESKNIQLAKMQRAGRRKKGNKTHQLSTAAYISQMSKQNYTGTFQGIGFPDRFNCKLRYSENGSFTSSAAPAAQVFRVNSLFDPNQTGAGHQPSFFDVANLCYSAYYVRGVWARVTLTNQSSSMSFYGVAVFSDNDASSQLVETMSESRYAKEITLGTTGAINSKVIDMGYIDMGQLMGTKGNLESGANFYSPTTTNPVDIAYFYFKVGAVDGSTAGVVSWKVDIIYDCVFKDVNPSYSS